LPTLAFNEQASYFGYSLSDKAFPHNEEGFSHSTLEELETRQASMIKSFSFSLYK